jgi:hypothetical protein
MKSITNRYKPPTIRNRIEDLNRAKAQLLAMKARQQPKSKFRASRSNLPNLRSSG